MKRSITIKASVLLLAVFPCVAVCSDSNQGDSRKTIDKDHKTKIIAHRGASGIAPENTVASIKLAFEKNADVAEIDTFLSKDGRVMVIHDETTKRTAGVDWVVSKTDSAKLRQLDVGSWKSPDYAGEKIPFLEDIIEVIPEGKELFIDAKYDPNIVPHLKKVIYASNKKGQMLIASIKFDVVVACKKQMPDVPVYWGFITERDKKTGRYLPYDTAVIEKAVANGFAGLSLHHKGLTKKYVEKAHKAGLKIIVWTVDGINDAKRLMEYNVDGIATKLPGVIKSHISD
ncbi:MAG: hypothetical protein JXM70_12410 [Pirellulales bacterium]|nr:hypothetical protein [Pirellulales bacterium]